MDKWHNEKIIEFQITRKKCFLINDYMILLIRLNQPSQ